MVQIYVEKVVTRYDPHSNPEWGVMTPDSTQKLASMVIRLKKYHLKVRGWQNVTKKWVVNIYVVHW